jgi:hypothetical protein
MPCAKAVTHSHRARRDKGIDSPTAEEFVRHGRAIEKAMDKAFWASERAMLRASKLE